MRYQLADTTAVAVLVERLSPQLYRFFATQLGSQNYAEDMLQEVWLRIHRVRHTYRLGDPLLPWVYAIARRVRVDSYRKRHRIASHEMGVKVLPVLPVQQHATSNLPPFDELVAALPESQREVLTMLKVNGLSIEEVARATSSTVGASIATLTMHANFLLIATKQLCVLSPKPKVSTNANRLQQGPGNSLKQNLLKISDFREFETALGAGGRAFKSPATTKSP